jgi:hypothetical protein
MEIKELLKKPSDCWISSDHPAEQDPEHWCVGPVVLTRDSDLLAESNWDALEKALKAKEEFDDQWESHRFSHWAVGWVEHLSFRVLDEKGEPTAIYHFLKKWFDALDDYPVADEEDFSRREFEGTLENIEAIGGRMVKDGAPDTWPDEVERWFWDNDQRQVEPRDGGGGWPSDEAMREALGALGYLDEEE